MACVGRRRTARVTELLLLPIALRKSLASKPAWPALKPSEFVRMGFYASRITLNTGGCPKKCFGFALSETTRLVGQLQPREVSLTIRFNDFTGNGKHSPLRASAISKFGYQCRAGKNIP